MFQNDSFPPQAKAQLKLKADGELTALTAKESWEPGDLDRMANLLSLKSKLSGHRINTPLLIGLVLLTAVIITILAFRRISQTEVELDAEVSQVGFNVRTPQNLMLNTTFTRIDVDEAAALSLPEVSGLGSKTFAGDPATGLSAIFTSERNDTSSPPGTISLSALVVPDLTKVDVTQARQTTQLEIMLTAPDTGELTVDLSLSGSVSIAVHDTVETPFAGHSTYAYPRACTARGHRLRLTMTPPTGVPIPFQSQLMVENLSLVHEDETSSTLDTIPRQGSSVLAGNLYFEELDSKQFPLRFAEFIQIPSSVGVLRQLAPKPESSSRTLAGNKLKRDEEPARLGVRFSGAVRGLRTGYAPADRSLMPTYVALGGAILGPSMPTA